MLFRSQQVAREIADGDVPAFLLEHPSERTAAAAEIQNDAAGRHRRRVQQTPVGFRPQGSVRLLGAAIVARLRVTSLDYLFHREESQTFRMLTGIVRSREFAAGQARWRFVAGVLSASPLPLCKPVWQYLWLLLLGWLLFAILRTRSRPALDWLIAGSLVVAAPGFAWMKRDYDAWRVFTLPVSKPYVQKVSAEGILLWAGGLLPES